MLVTLRSQRVQNCIQWIEWVLQVLWTNCRLKWHKANTNPLDCKQVNMKTVCAEMNTTKAVVKIRPEKIQGCTGFEPMTSAIPVQCSTLFFRCYFHYCVSSVHYGKDCFHVHFFICSSHLWFSCIHSYINLLCLFCKQTDSGSASCKEGTKRLPGGKNWRIRDFSSRSK